MNDYQLTEDDLFTLWEIFISLDEKKKNRLTLGQLFDQIDERDYSIIAPYLERFYELIDIRLPEQETLISTSYGPPMHDSSNPNIKGMKAIELANFKSKTAISAGEKPHLSKYHYGCSFSEFLPVLVGFCLFS